MARAKARDEECPGEGWTGYSYRDGHLTERTKIRVRYIELDPISRHDAEEALSSASSATVCYALARVVHHDSDWRWLQDKCIQMTSHPDMDVVRLSISLFGDIARIHGNLDLDTVLPLLKRLHENTELAGRVEDAWDDIAVYLHAGPHK